MAKATKLIIGNWKMFPETITEAQRIFTTFKRQKRIDAGVTTVFCPPFPFIAPLKRTYTGTKIFFGAQDVFWQKEGAYTGEVSVGMLKSLGVRFVIVGHSERRALGESDEAVSQKLRAALDGDMHTVLCIGEGTRDSHGTYLRVLREQITGSLRTVTGSMLKKLIIAYEPVWAIGEGKQAMSTHDIHQTMLFIKKQLAEHYGQKAGFAVPILYGGSVDETNAHAIVHESGVDGLLVGRKSLNPYEFSIIINEVSRKPVKAKGRN
ncbi:MAG: hypothetical protein RL150_501 [Candidatus Parcubacteria bacterium]|jgi:triosephosphate isomerase